jgi:phenylpropionate dioxygenase-like ring-hydroxylating dioxygenase large terminal subunit
VASPGQESFLRNIWYYAMPAAKLRRGTMLAKTLLGEPILFCRKQDGSIFALRDVCPHRAMPLSYGRFDGEQVECCYHGWIFNDVGRCTAIPSLTGHEGIEPEKICVRHYPVREQQGNIWIYISEPQEILPTELPEPPAVPDFGMADAPRHVETMTFPCFIDHAVVGLMDPAHGPFVHQSWWWRSRRSIHEKSKVFGPSHFGFTMRRHAPSSNSFAYKILGGKPETEISFQLPGVRIEHIRAGSKSVVNLTAVTPASETATEINHSIYWNIPFLSVIKPLLRPFVRRFLAQDRDVVVRQQEGLRHEQNLLLIRDADTQARWYYQLKNEYQRAQAEKRAFNNPVKETTLRWRS